MKSHDEMAAFARATLGFSPSREIEFIPLSGRGSERSYFRLKWAGGQSAVLMHYKPERTENSYFADIASFLHEIGIPVPAIIRQDAAKYLILMEDLGDTDLWSLRSDPWEIRRAHYRRTLAAAHRLHSFSIELFPSNRVKLMEPFGAALYQWERDYFMNNFVGRLCGIELEPKRRAMLEFELADLADRLQSNKQTLVHRDLQSQNVLIRGGDPFLIDFQGMRFGTPFYDLGSLLCDPYVSLSETERDELLFYYYGLSGVNPDWKDYRRVFWEASAQRLMQALGAYAFLGLSRGLKNYLVYVPAGLKNLGIAAENTGSLPRLRELCAQCEQAEFFICGAARKGRLHEMRPTEAL